MGRFSNISLKVAACPYTPYVVTYEKEGRMQFYGLTASILANITAALNISYEVILPEDGTWGIIAEDGTYTGMLKEAYEKKADVGIGPFTMDESLRRDFHLSSINGYIELGITSAAGDPMSAGNNAGILGAFDISTWITLMLSLACVAIITPILQRYSRKSTGIQEKLRLDFFDYQWMYLSALLKQGPKLFRIASGTKAIVGAWLLGSLVLTTYFTSLIVATLTVRLSTPRIDSVEDLVQRLHLAPLVASGTQLVTLLETSPSEPYQKLQAMIVRHQSLRDVADLFNTRDIDDVMREKAVYVMDKTSPKVHLAHLCSALQGRFYISRGSVYIWNSVWVANKDMSEELVLAMNKRIKWWVESAVPTMHSYELNPPSATCFADYRKEASYAFVNMTFRDFTGVFFMYLAACAVALVLFVLEVAVGRPAA